MATCKALFVELQPLVTTFDGHAWDWAAHLIGERTPQRNEPRSHQPSGGMSASGDGRGPAA